MKASKKVLQSEYDKKQIYLDVFKQVKNIEGASHRLFKPAKNRIEKKFAESSVRTRSIYNG